MNEFDLGQRIALEWVENQLENLLEQETITDVMVKQVAERISNKISNLWKEVEPPKKNEYGLGYMQGRGAS